MGSQENEVLTVGYLLEQIQQIRVETAAGPHQLTVDVQRPTGTFSIDFLGGFTSFYDRVTNVVVRLEPKGGAQHLMLANCHFDTVANSPGQKRNVCTPSVVTVVSKTQRTRREPQLPLKSKILFTSRLVHAALRNATPALNVHIQPVCCCF